MHSDMENDLPTLKRLESDLSNDEKKGNENSENNKKQSTINIEIFYV